MLLHKPHLFTKSLSTSTPSKPIPKWRTLIKQTKLVSEITSILLQRHNWVPLLQTLNLSPSKLTPSLFLQILNNTQSHPQISLNFFNFATTKLAFQPDLKTQCKLTHILIQAKLSQPAKPILNSLIQTHPLTQILDSFISFSKGTDSHSLVLGSVVECYCHKGLYLQALEVFQKSKYLGHVVSIHSCNALLNTLEERNEIRLGWCFYACMFRSGVVVDRFTWSIIARILWKDGKFERIGRIIDMGIYNSVMYNLIIEGYSERGDFKVAFDYLNEMCDRKLDTGFNTYCSILEGGCKCGDVEVIDLVMNTMVERVYIPKVLLMKYDLVIQKLSDLGKTYTADMFFKRALNEKIQLQDASYGCMLRALSKKGRVEDAIGIYHIILRQGSVVNDSCYNAFVDALCKEEPSEEVSKLLRDVIGRGFRPCSLELSNYVSSQCRKGRWRDAEELLNVILEKGFLPDRLCCSSLVKHYCSSRRIESAIALHNKIEKLEVCLDVATYNVLLNQLLKERKVEEALRVFDYMRKQNVLDSGSFSSMIFGLCHENELRKAMKLHDEMLKMGLKPNGKTYRKLICGFK